MIEDDLPVPLASAWEYLTQPDTRAILVSSDNADIKSLANGRITTGTEYVCAHGKSVIVHRIVDWVPLQYYTYVFDPIKGGTVVSTVELEDRGDTTHVVYTAGARGSFLKRAIVNMMGRTMGAKYMRAGLTAVRERVAADVASNPPNPAQAAS